MGYIKPKEVIYSDVKVIRVLYDGGSKFNSRPYSIAIIERHGKQSVAMRWNGSDEKPIGFPSFGKLPTWFIIPKEVADGVISKLVLETAYDNSRDE